MNKVFRLYNFLATTSMDEYHLFRKGSEMKNWKTLSLGALLIASQAQAYDVVSRYKIIDDKLKTEQMLRPYGHDFLLDISAGMNKNIMDVIDDVDKATKTQGNDADKLAEATRILTKYDKTEQTVKVNIALGTPLPSFTAFDVGFKPNFRVLVDVGANLGIRSEKLTVADVIDFFPEDIPADLRSFVLGLAPNQDVIVECKASAALSATTKAFCATQPEGRYIIPSATQDVPKVEVFGKADVKGGFFNDYSYGEHWFGQWNLYGMGRADLYQIVTAKQIASGQSIEAPDKMNTEVTLQTDYRLGYKNTNYTAFLGVEEIKLATLTDPDVGSKPHTYGYKALMRAHADATYRWNALSIQPFVGVHKRSGYSMGDGVYGGTALGAFVWGDRLGLQLRAMADKQYLTISPRLKLWLMQLEYSLKNPMKSTDGDVKLSAIHSLDFRLFF